jgi:hypothetical protein
MLIDLREIYEKYEINGKVRIEYDTEIFYGQLD